MPLFGRAADQVLLALQLRQAGFPPQWAFAIHLLAHLHNYSLCAACSICSCCRVAVSMAEVLLSQAAGLFLPCRWLPATLYRSVAGATA